MKLFLLIALFVAGTVAADPTKCNECLEDDKASCLADQEDDLMCATDRKSLGSTHCVTAVGKYSDDDEGGNISTLFFRGCIDCEKACFALGGWLKAEKQKTLLECEIECCTSDNCNNQTTPTLTKDAITVFTPNVSGPAQCIECFGSNAPLVTRPRRTKLVLLIEIHSAQPTAVPLREHLESMTEMSAVIFLLEDVLTVQIKKQLVQLSVAFL
ncbi:hypothetical protein OS493_032303 [Desmophyllum pertusum]|uniref:Sodefrin-like factor n=1 Tax=Desmophyllum pertusum TaxID=174260 RepID=A0A9W9YVV7_9CNID|nr:hypothetical protein OS493_032303 [Desmophyllum pertusum]